ncbi:hypothetical protein [Aquisalinus flavus]|uniref:Uncharacterized protein n=1 Tax=Aquisalinus flavus TaxID=1526572 RepID=A0A8J2Y690_9PROT|nr:hypothetical protein [Aquisalinus flavus]MBD0427276.1 hypothetical protein [Aquisalinus flavus]UNE47088.1 hypothetical protein FF099_02945 [Aquisalinus flavus]GGC99712.1 hypothetical protein GCM10011342_05910 [Aquisalinus flavus]
MTTDNDDTRAFLPLAFGAGVIILAIMTVAAAKEFGWLDGSAAKRLVGVSIAAMLVLMGNYIPKAGFLQLFVDAPRKSLARADLMAGRILCLAGVVIIGVWAFAAIENAQLGAALIGLAAFFLAVASWLMLKPTHTGEKS